MTQRAVLEPRNLTDQAVVARRRAALWALGLGALAVAIHVVRLVNLPAARAARREASAGHVVLDSPAVTIDDVSLFLGGIAFYAAGIFACIWLVRAYREGRQRDPTLKPVSDNWLWVMWLAPVVQWIAPVLRLRGLVRAAGVSGIRGWLVYLWAAVWIAVDFFQRHVGTSVSSEGADVGATMLWTAGLALAFALWAALVITIDRGLDLQRPGTAPARAVSSDDGGRAEGVS